MFSIETQQVHRQVGETGSHQERRQGRRQSRAQAAPAALRGCLRRSPAAQAAQECPASLQQRRRRRRRPSPAPSASPNDHRLKPGTNKGHDVPMAVETTSLNHGTNQRARRTVTVAPAEAAALAAEVAYRRHRGTYRRCQAMRKGRTDAAHARAARHAVQSANAPAN